MMNRAGPQKAPPGMPRDGAKAEPSLLLSHGQRVGPQQPLSGRATAVLFLLGAALGAVGTGSVLVLFLGLQQQYPEGASTSPHWDFARDEQAVWGAGGAQGECAAGVPVEDLDLGKRKGQRRKSSPGCCAGDNVWEQDRSCDYDAGLVSWAMNTAGGQVDLSEDEDDLSWIPEALGNSSDSPWVQILEEGNRELEAAVNALRQHSPSCFRSTPLGRILDGALKKISERQTCGVSSAAMGDPDPEVADLDADSAEDEEPQHAPLEKCDMTQAVADQMIIPPAPPPPPLPDDLRKLPVKERVAACFRLYELAEDVQLAEDIAYQLLLQEQREERLRQIRWDWLKGLEQHRQWWEGLNITAKEAQAKYKALPDGDPEKQRLEEFLRAYLPFEEWWKREGPDHKESGHSLNLQKLEAQEADARHQHRVAEADAVKKRLKEECGLALPHSDWKEEQQRVLHKYQQVIDASGVEGYCIDWRTVAPEFEAQSSLHAPRKFWKKIPEVYPDWPGNLTFIVTWRSPDTAAVRRMWERLYRCTGGWTEGEGEIPGVKAEMLINVFNPEETLDAWLEGWHATDSARFVVPVLPNAKGDVGAYTTLVRTAHGDIIVFLRDGDEVPETCTWLTDMLSSFAAWPRLGMVGYHTEQPRTLESTPVGTIMKSWWKKGRTLDKQALQDPITGVRMHFTGLVHSSPFAVRRTALLRLGNLDENDPCAVKSAQAFSWQLCSRIWLSGFQVAKMHTDPPTDPSGKQGIRNYEGAEGSADCGCYAGYFQHFNKHIIKEVNRLNKLLKKP